MKDLKIISCEKVHETIVGYIGEHRVVIGDYEDMKECVINMIRGGYCFAMDRDRLRDAMEDINFMCSPEDDANRDRVYKSLEYDDESDEDFDDEFGCAVRGASATEATRQPEPESPVEDVSNVD
jgi:hypothetical protein